MRLLLDTHAFLWSASSPDQLSAAARSAIEDGANEVLVSPVSGWEIAIKQSLGKLVLPSPAESWVVEVVRRLSFDVTAVELGAALRVRSLPWHHRDPFDRLLIAQALEESLTIVTCDEVFGRYGAAVLGA